MIKHFSIGAFSTVAALCLGVAAAPMLRAQNGSAASNQANTTAVSSIGDAAQGEVVLHAAEAAKILPGSVFFRGQSATAQVRNSGGVRFADGFYMLVTLVDTSGYSTGVQAKYQACLLTEVPLTINGKTLPPGAYGVGFIADNKFNVLDIGAHELFTVDSTRDAELKRPTPLQVLPGGEAHSYRLYSGRSYVTIARGQ